MSTQEHIIYVKVIPQSHRNQIIGWESEELRIKLAAIPEKGNANKALIKFLAKCFGLRQSQVEIMSGETSRHKKIKLQGITNEEFQKIISHRGVKEEKNETIDKHR